jgi:hypothetical protein
MRVRRVTSLRRRCLVLHRRLFEPTALVLNILVASIGTFQFWRAGSFLVEIILAIRAVFRSGRIRRRRRFAVRVILFLLATVLLIAGMKLFFTK